MDVRLRRSLVIREVYQERETVMEIADQDDSLEKFFVYKKMLPEREPWWRKTSNRITIVSIVISLISIATAVFR